MGKRSEHVLLEVDRDPEVGKHPHYRAHPLKEDVPYSKYLGVKDGENVRLIYGNHRAIHQARQFVNDLRSLDSLEICVPKS